MMKKNNLSEILKELRIQHKLKQSDLGELLKVSDKTISSWEKDRSEPKIDQLLELSKYFNVSIDYLIKGK